MSTGKYCVVVGGGAAGYFAAINCAESSRARVVIVEAGRAPLQKVRISGGGRCNVTHACFEPRDLVNYYPRGARALLGPFSRFQPRDTIAWFESRGVEIKAEADGRCFPVTDDSETIAACLENAARAAGVEVITQAPVTVVERVGTALRVCTKDGAALSADAVLLASGGAPAGLRFAQELGHRIIPPVPALFTLRSSDPRLRDLAGISVSAVELRLPAFDLEESGPLLVTHEGLSGPAVLKLSSRAARDLHAVRYRTELRVRWIPGLEEQRCAALLRDVAARYGARQVHSVPPEISLPRRLWRRLVEIAGIAPETQWAGLRADLRRNLERELVAGVIAVDGRGEFKEEFVTCGGVDLREVDFRTMQSRVCPGLYFAGEILDIDALTGGFNFQNAWTTGWLAGRAMAATPSESV